MNDAEDELDIRRILVALDASAHSMAALEAAVQLASELHAEVTGLFVEDLNLLAMADRALAEAAEHARVRHEFRTVRGSVLAEVLKASTEHDLVTLGHLGWSPTGRRGVGSTARHLIDRSAGLVLVARHALELGLPVFVVYDGTAAGRQALSLGVRLAGAMDGGLTVVTPADRSTTPDRMAGDAARLAAEAADRILARNVESKFQAVATDDPSAIAVAARAGRAGLIVMPLGGDWLTPELVQRVAGMVRCPVLMVRKQPEGSTSTQAGATSAA
jgi:nucleotide-binding universal stress UspA family protein